MVEIAGKPARRDGGDRREASKSYGILELHVFV